MTQDAGGWHKASEMAGESECLGCAVHVSYHGAAEIEYAVLEIGHRNTVQKEKASQNDQKQEGLIPMDTSVKQL